MKEMKEMKVSAVVGLSVTVLAVVTAITFSFASVAYQREALSLRKVNAEYKKLIVEYKTVLENIKAQLMKVGVKA